MPIGELILLSLFAALALWRAASLIHDEPGPYEIMDRLRKKVGVEYVDDEIAGYPARLQPLECFWCLALIVSIPWGVYIAIVGTVMMGLVAWLATSTMVIIIERWIGRSKSRLF